MTTTTNTETKFNGNLFYARLLVGDYAGSLLDLVELGRMSERTASKKVNAYTKKIAEKYGFKAADLD